ncbi:hypothetical protein ONS95_000447 [Cadophora gregata]|uniref:uncharacterized protein n=1 Tax=Cadophora gregata TaxID=51156 RepID=UPI0026DA7E2D|nr:uncharacterized protein ONS95_000447 [Cadophora gregata]KAK0125545.1 hypothetical protein ONS96_009382 [Cadophora gregata f. sp. sojae]KAK0128475.1 hypothetical protein ONS95_000447 [Cadophora gregata]
MAPSISTLPKRALNLFKRPKSSEAKDKRSSSPLSKPQSQSSSEEGRNIASVQVSIQSSPTSSLASNPQQSEKEKRQGKTKTKANNISAIPEDHQSRDDAPQPFEEATSSEEKPISLIGMISELFPSVPDTEPIILPHAGSEHTHTCIFLHDWNSHGSDLAIDFLTNNKSRTNQTLTDIFPTMRFVFPTARLAYSDRRIEEFVHSPQAGVLQGREVIPQWFDHYDLENPISEDEKKIDLARLEDTICDIVEIILNEASIVGLKNIVLGGIGPGAAIALLTLLAGAQDVGAFVGWGGWLPFQKEIANVAGKCFDNRLKISRQVEDILRMNGSDDEDEKDGIEKAKGEDGGKEWVHDVWNESFMAKEKSHKPLAMTPILLCHTDDDEVVPYRRGRDMSRTLNSLGFQGQWNKYKGGFGGDEGGCVDDMADFLEAMLTIQGRSSVWYDDEADELEASGLPSNWEKILEEQRKRREQMAREQKRSERRKMRKEDKRDEKESREGIKRS